MICDVNLCTACGACENICKKGAIKKVKKWDDSWYMEIDSEACVECGLCKKVCPNLNLPEENYPFKAYAAWSNDEKIHATSASGGIATELYRYAVRNEQKFAGVAMNRKNEAHFFIREKEADIKAFKNSKYTFSFMDRTFESMYQLMKNGHEILFIGLPCQVAAVKNYMKIKNIPENRMLTVDIACHGTPSPEFLKQHVQQIEKIKKTKIEKIFFRDPKFHTDYFYFTLYDATGKLVYKKKVKSDDSYQIGYHSALIYRDSCYQCKYAKRERQGDLTIADYHGLGNMEPFTLDVRSVSCILVNTKRGEEVVQSMSQEGFISAYERPVKEALDGEPQFNHPSNAPKERESFVKEYEKSRDFHKASRQAFKRMRIDNRIRTVKETMMSIFPRDLKDKVKQSLRR